ncbi:hypothetical protein [Mucilaginibacter sp. SJ]|uniref:hypothetical protein n=1 Tax=Mucilaginibacter sp. SJ TaxID=3029053 RepID=UPI0023AA1250|nr:hypothetical protein [Mucilaginibacter sp. SJ]WEA00551.1 hypothetical protein MusilaSJ_24145 [Mucilaginibacter sp. SJ]
MKTTPDDELDRLIRNAINETTSLPLAFAHRTAEHLLARHHKRQLRYLLVRGMVYFLFALAGSFGLAWLINVRMALSLIAELVAYKSVFVFGICTFAAGIMLNKDDTRSTRNDLFLD